MSSGIAGVSRSCVTLGVVRVSFAAVLALVGLACDKPDPAPGADTAVEELALPAVPDSINVAVESPWNADAGPVFIVGGPNSSTASVVIPSISSDAEIEGGRASAVPYVGMSFDLLGNGRAVGFATLSAVVPIEPPEECSGWPLVQLSGVPEDSVGRGWVVGLERGRAAPVPYDSIAGLSSSDSSRLAIEIARMASRLPGDTVAELRGLPYQVRRAYRFPLAEGGEGLVTEVWRTLNQEANPKQEHLLIIAERDSASRGRLDLAYTERTAGSEETLESSELLAVARFGAARDVSILLARYVGDGVIFSLLERSGNRRWRLRWSSPYVGC